MNIQRVEATNIQTKEKLRFEFGTMSREEKIVTNKAGKLNKYLEFCFSDDVKGKDDVVVFFLIKENEFSIRKYPTEDGAFKHTLKQRLDGKMKTIASGKNVLPTLQTFLDLEVEFLLEHDFISDKVINDFNGDLLMFKEMQLLAEMSENIKVSNDKLLARQNEVKETLRKVTDKEQKRIKKSHLEKVTSENKRIGERITQLNLELAELKAKRASSEINGEIITELADAQTKYRELLKTKNQIEQMREQIALRDEVAVLVPKVQQLFSIGEVRDQAVADSEKLLGELEWQENELASIVLQLEEKINEATKAVERHSKLEVVNQELKTIVALYAENKDFNVELNKLNEQAQSLNVERVRYKNKLSDLEQKIAEFRTQIKDFEAPNSTFAEMLEAVRVDVKIDEVQAQIDKTNSEIGVKQSQIAEREHALSNQVKQFKAVAELDVAIAPMKARDTVLQVLETRYSKLDHMHKTLQDKHKNLQRTYEDTRYTALQLEHSKGCLENDLAALMLKKQEEFKREVYLNSQKVYTNDASSVFAVNAGFADEEVETMKQEIERRKVECDEALERSAEIQGKLEEIERQIAILESEMDTLNEERDNIDKHYKEIISKNRSEAVFNYIKAMETNNGTRYLLDIQQDAVRSEAELVELRNSIANLRAKLSGLQSRMRYLKDTHRALAGGEVNAQIAANEGDQMQETLYDISEQLASCYEQHRELFDKLEELESAYQQVQESIVEVRKSIKINQHQIDLSTEKAKKYAGTSDIEKAIATYRYDLDDLDSERQMLTESKVELEKDVFKRRLELEKLQYVYYTKDEEYKELFEVLQYELNAKGIDIEKIETANFEQDSAKMRKAISQYDLSMQQLTERIENYYKIIKAQPNTNLRDINHLAGRIEEVETEINKLIADKKIYDQLQQKVLESYINQSRDSIDVAVAAGKAMSLKNIAESIKQNEVVNLLIKDRMAHAVASVQKYLNQIAGKGLELVVDGNNLKVKKSGAVFAFDQLSMDTKYLVYIALLVGMPGQDKTTHWLIFDEKASLPKTEITEIMNKLDVDCVVGFEAIKPKEIAVKPTKSATKQSKATVKSFDTANNQQIDTVETDDLVSQSGSDEEALDFIKAIEEQAKAIENEAEEKDPPEEE